MGNKEFKAKQNLYNIVSVVVLILFILLESVYLKIFSDNGLSDFVDSFPRNVIQKLNADKNVLESTIESVDEILESITQNEELETEKNRFNSNYRIATVSELYFENALFVGDSRMHGFSIYRQLPGATYFCYESADAFTILEKEYELEPYGTTNLYNLLMMKSFDKIYISLGINNVAAGLENHKNHYKKLLDTVKELQPNAIIYLLANLHVSGDINSNNKYLNNDNINYINKFISEFEDKKQVFYFDPNEVYDDEFGNMDSELSYDKAHIYLRHYDRLLYFLITHAVVYDE